MLGSGDLYAIGVETVVAYRPSGPRPGAIPSEYADFRLPSADLVPGGMISLGAARYERM